MDCDYAMCSVFAHGDRIVVIATKVHCLMFVLLASYPEINTQCEWLVAISDLERLPSDGSLQELNSFTPYLLQQRHRLVLNYVVSDCGIIGHNSKLTDCM